MFVWLLQEETSEFVSLLLFVFCSAGSCWFILCLCVLEEKSARSPLIECSVSPRSVGMLDSADLLCLSSSSGALRYDCRAPRRSLDQTTTSVRHLWSFHDLLVSRKSMHSTTTVRQLFLSFYSLFTFVICLTILCVLVWKPLVVKMHVCIFWLTWSLKFGVFL